MFPYGVEGNLWSARGGPLSPQATRMTSVQRRTRFPLRLHSAYGTNGQGLISLCVVWFSLSFS